MNETTAPEGSLSDADPPLTAPVRSDEHDPAARSRLHREQSVTAGKRRVR